MRPNQPRELEIDLLLSSGGGCLAAGETPPLLLRLLAREAAYMIHDGSCGRRPALRPAPSTLNRCERLSG
jgi:hypothetical protein